MYFVHDYSFEDVDSVVRIPLVHENTLNSVESQEGDGKIEREFWSSRSNVKSVMTEDSRSRQARRYGRRSSRRSSCRGDFLEWSAQAGLSYVRVLHSSLSLLLSLSLTRGRSSLLE